MVNRWCYIGTATNEDQLWSLLESKRVDEIEFDPDVYKLLRKHLSSVDQADVRVLKNAPVIPSWPE